MNPRRLRKFNRFLALIALAMVGIATVALFRAQAGSDEPVFHSSDTHTPEQDWKVIPKALGHAGEMGPQVYTVTLPREDLDVQNPSGSIPAAAGLSHQFHFFRCSCGKMSVVGQFCVAEYEANDVMDALRATSGFKIVSVSPMLLEETPRVLSVRFQAEGGSKQLAETLKSALEWTGEARMAPTSRPTPSPPL